MIKCHTLLINFKTKKALKEAVAAWNDERIKVVLCYQPGLGPDLSNYTGKINLEGPHYPEAHKWWAQAEMINGIVVKVS